MACDRDFSFRKTALGLDGLFFHGDIFPGTEVTQNSSIARNKAKQNSPLERVPKHL
jgi:hypothetical protein